jgi:hypothetical protein
MAYREGSPFAKLGANTVHTCTASLCCTFDQLLDVLFRYLRFSQRFCWRCKSSGVMLCRWESGRLKVTASHPSRLHSSYFRSFKIVIEYYAFRLLLGLISKRTSKIVLNLGNTIPILGVRNILFFFVAFAELRKATIGIMESVCPSAWNNSASTGGFSWNLILGIFRKKCREHSRLVKTGEEERVLYMKTYVYFWSYISHFFLEWEMFRTAVVEEIKTQILCSVTSLRKSCHLWDNVEKYYRAGQTTYDNMAHAHCMLGN